MEKNQLNNTASVFATLNAINCNGHTEKKNGLTYLSWAWAWQIVKNNYPQATYTVYETADGRNYFTDGRTCWVKTGVTIEGLEHIEYLPVLDFRAASIPVDKVTSFDVNKAIQRSLTKACARHGLGLYIYAGEDLPGAADDEKREAVKAAPKQTKKVAEVQPGNPMAPTAKPLCTMAHYKGGKCGQLVAALAKHNCNDIIDWAEGVKELKDRYEFEDGVLSQIAMEAEKISETSHA